MSVRTRAALLSVLVVVGGCASVPWSTMWKMRNVTVDRFFANDPAQLRVAIQVDRAMKRGSGQPEVEADVRPTGSKRLCYAFVLAPVDPSARAEPVLEKLAANRAWSVFALSPAGIEAFRRARREVGGLPKDVGGEFRFGVTMTDVFAIPEDAKSVPFRIDVALDREDGYFTLIEETAIALKTTAKPERPVAPKPATPPADACPPT